MRIWGMADPRDLRREHLLGEHFELHIMINGGWSNHPESIRMRADNFRWARFRHELIRHEMNQRWPQRHGLNHPTPVDTSDFTPKLDTALMVTDDVEPFASLMKHIGFPPTSLRADTPWDRDDLTKEAYIQEAPPKRGLKIRDQADS